MKTCIPTTAPVAILRADYKAICGGNDCAAMALSLFDAWQTEQVGNVWMEKTETEIAEGLLNHYSRKTLRAGVRLLAQLGLIGIKTRHNSFIRTKFYQFRKDCVQGAIDIL